jgi:hypothetical protein
MAKTIKANPAALELVLKMESLDEMLDILKEYGNPDGDYIVGTKIQVDNKMQKGYEYELVEPVGKNFAADFKPNYTPLQMLREGVFGGKYCNDTILEYPKSWFEDGRFSPEGNNSLMNRFKGDSRTPIANWVKEGWLFSKHDPRGWFEWYMRYFLGRRIEEEFEGQPYDRYQINRWKSFARHFGQVKVNCDANDMECRANQRQALLQWSWPAYGTTKNWVDFSPPKKDEEDV